MRIEDEGAGPAAERGRRDPALWNPRDGHVEVSVRDIDTGVGFNLEVAQGSALDAFYHPYAYAAALGRRNG